MVTLDIAVSTPADFQTSTMNLPRDDPRRRRRGWADTSRYFLAMAVPIVTIHVYSTIRTTEQVYMYGRRRNPTKMIITDDGLPTNHNHSSIGSTPHADDWSLSVIQRHQHMDAVNETLRLRFDWTTLRPISPLANAMDQHQKDCRLPPANFWFRNRFGLGSDLHVYSQALCNALEAGKHRVATVLDWIWADQQVCRASPSAPSSPMRCYFPTSEPICPPTHDNNTFHTFHNLTRGRGRISNECPTLTIQHGIPAIRAASTEFLFTRVSPVVQNEATRQLQLVFNGHDTVPTGLITVHIRWGDKGDEMTLIPIESYVDAVARLLLLHQQQKQQQRQRQQQQQQQQQHSHQEPARILLATEDPDAVQAFRNAAPDDWTIYVDHYFHEMLPHRRNTYNGSPLMSKDLRGRPGLVALGSLLVSMEANAFVLTTNSNWSRLMNEIRKNIIDPRCGNCTMMIDLSPGEW
jgi:hypothetical protein